MENCPNGNLAKVAKFHTNPYNFLACLPNPYKLSILGDICRTTILPFSSSKCLYILAFQTYGKQPYSFPVLSRFCNGLFYYCLNEGSFILSIHAVQQFQTGAICLKRAFKVALFSCLVQNSIKRVESQLLTVEGKVLNYNCNMAKQTAVIFL